MGAKKDNLAEIRAWTNDALWEAKAPTDTCAYLLFILLTHKQRAAALELMQKYHDGHPDADA